MSDMNLVKNLPLCLIDIAKTRLSEIPIFEKITNEKFKSQLIQSLALSDFVYNSLVQDPTLLDWLYQHSEYELRATQYRTKLKNKLAQISDEMSLLTELRRFRRQEMLWLAWQDFNQQISLDASLSHLSKLAEAIILESYEWLYQKSCDDWGTPCDSQGNAQPMLILAMGKLGGAELNFSSDIDLIFAYPENGETQGVRRPLSNSQFFTRLGQRLIKSLDQQNFDGFCYRVDMRLRPFGDSGALVMSFSAFEDYYQEQGRDWERYAMIKARVLGKEQFACYSELRQMLRPFVFRRYIDFSAIESLRKMKASIQSEVRRRGLTNNIKLGAGGIREIEFIAQSFQLIRGGREPTLRKRGLLITLDAIKELQLLTAEEVEKLINAYRYLRRVENLLQAIDDKQTQTLPEDEINQTRLAFAMEKETWFDLVDEIQFHMSNVNQIFADLVGNEDNEKDAIAVEYQDLWQSEDKQLLQKILISLSISNEEHISSLLFSFKSEIAKRTIGPRGREVLDRLMPKILQQLFAVTRNDSVLNAVLLLLSQILTRTTYLELLDEHKAAVEQLIKLCSASPMIAQKIATFPMLLDELIDPSQLYNPIAISEYKSALLEYLARIPVDDMEQQMEQIRQFKQVQLLKIAAADIAGVLPVMVVSDHLTFLAEAIVEAVVHQAWEQLKQKHGIPDHLVQNPELGYGFAILGYGKLGGLELGYSSDLDLVFVHDCPENIMTNGEKQIDGRQFYLRLTQRIMHLFSTRTSSGILYEIDTRLRPSGASGMLITTLSAFEQYQHNDAWVWEHQSLVRARVIFANPSLCQALEQIRKDVLCVKRELPELKQEVVSMREKMREHLGSKKTNLTQDEKNPLFHLKQDKGGIVDIEFITQFLVLAYSHQLPILSKWSDNVRILDEMSNAGILSSKQIKDLQQAYINLRHEIHRLSLLDDSSYAKAKDFEQERQNVAKNWQHWFES